MPNIHPQRIKIGGRHWTITSAPMVGFDGLAENDPRTRNKHIWIGSHVRGKDLLDTIIHEVTHCAYPFLTEEAVLQFATELADILWKLDYRSSDLGDED